VHCWLVAGKFFHSFILDFNFIFSFDLHFTHCQPQAVSWFCLYPPWIRLLLYKNGPTLALDERESVDNNNNIIIIIKNNLKS